MSYNLVFLYIKDLWLNFIFETLDNIKNNQKMDQKIKRRFQVSQFLSENSNSLIVRTSLKFWWKINNILGYIKKWIFSKFYEIWGKFKWKIRKTVKRNFLKNNRKILIFCIKLMSYNVVFLYIKDFLLDFIFETLDDKKK